MNDKQTCPERLWEGHLTYFSRWRQVSLRNFHSPRGRGPWWWAEKGVEGRSGGSFPMGGTAKVEIRIKEGAQCVRRILKMQLKVNMQEGDSVTRWTWEGTLYAMFQERARTLMIIILSDSPFWILGTVSQSNKVLHLAKPSTHQNHICTTQLIQLSHTENWLWKLVSHRTFWSFGRLQNPQNL